MPITQPFLLIRPSDLTVQHDIRRQYFARLSQPHDPSVSLVFNWLGRSYQS